MMIKVVEQGGTCDMKMIYIKEAGKLPFLEEATHSRNGSLRRLSGICWVVHALVAEYKAERRHCG